MSRSPIYLGIVPARAGSKRIPGKNLLSLAGRPLIDYTLEAALRSRRLGAVVVSTDSEAIAARARLLGASVPELRPTAIAGDTSPVIEALRHALDGHERGGPRAAAVVVLQPTSPLRTAQDIDAAIELFERTGADSVTAVRPVRDHPYWTWRACGETIEPFLSLDAMTADRSGLPPAYAENGAIYVVRRELVLQARMYGSRTVPYLMDEGASVDIDTLLDHAWAEFLLARQSSPGEGSK
jgi:CMP-N,N'-diacetyllegionaminic acid synthase